MPKVQCWWSFKRKPRIARIEEVLHDEHGSIKVSFFDPAVIRDSNKVEVLAVR